MLSYQTAYLKTYFPEHFMAAVLSTELGNTDKINTLINECKEMKIKVLTPDIKTSNKHLPNRIVIIMSPHFVFVQETIAVDTW